MNAFTIPLPATLGNNVGAGTDGVLFGRITPTALSACLLQRKAATSGVKCITDDGGLYVDESTAFNESTGDDVEVFAATPAVDDAVYIGHTTGKFSRLDVNITTKAVDPVLTVVPEYWDGSAWAEITAEDHDLVDGSEGLLVDATGIVSVTFTAPSDWARCTVDGVLGYFIRFRVSAFTSITTEPQVGQGWIVLDTAEWLDETTDINDADAGDVALGNAYPVVGDRVYFGYEAKFTKLKLTTGTAGVGTHTFGFKYWNGTEWADLTVADDSSGFTATAGTHLVHFEPPADWVANTADDGPNGEAGYFIAAELTALTTMTTKALATRAWVLPLMSVSRGGLRFPANIARVRITGVSLNAGTISGTTRDSTFMLLNATTGEFDVFDWTKAEAVDVADVDLYFNAEDELAIVQLFEDGSTEFAGAGMVLTAR